MNNLNLKTGLVSLTINGDPDNVLEFNPDDMLFAERYLVLLKDFEAKVDEFKNNFAALDKNTDPDDLDSAELKIKAAKEACIFVRDKIDYVFGAGTSKKLFGDALSMTAYANFFEGITPFIKKNRAEKVKKYQSNPRRQKGVMK